MSRSNVVLSLAFGLSVLAATSAVAQRQGFIIGFGILFCVIPGIIFACKLAFVPYLIVDRKLDAITAIKESWRLTTGHAITVFFIGLAARPIYLAGLLCCVVGVIFSSMWIDMTFASLYYAVTRSEESETNMSDTELKPEQIQA